MLNPIRNEAVGEVPHDDSVSEVPTQKLATPAENQLKRMLAMRPGLAEAIPAECKSDESKVLYVMTHHELAAQVKGVAFAMPVGSSGSLTLKPNGELEVVEKPGKKFTLNNKHDDFARLLEGSTLGYEAIRTNDMGDLLHRAVKAYYGFGPKYDGGALYENLRGLNTFAYLTMDQGLTSLETTGPSLECVAVADFHLYKSMGLIPPDLERVEVERRYTSIHGDSGGVRVGHAFDKSLRGIPGGKPFSPSEAVAFANALRDDDWAKLTGASRGPYALKHFPTIGGVVSHLTGGGGAVHSGWPNGGHHFVLSMAAPDRQGVIHVNQDDSLKSRRATSRDQNQWGYPTEYDPQIHSNFWGIVR